MSVHTGAGHSGEGGLSKRGWGVALGSLVLTVALAAPALADDHGRWKKHKHKHHHRGHGPVVIYEPPPPVVVMRRPPPVYYAPAPRVVYAPPPPVYYAPAPGLSVQMNIPLR
ncbi:hypothetical protein [Azospirillum brasilense]|uniref:hypothetical protein n=1 Tax=Azospirillum brasilense TaxID=192 RepID=UPI000E0A8ED6|nr:hypothetical protein [Azospirillum brasilense]